MFITFEGVEGSGKTTQVRLLAETLERRGQMVWTTREPGGTPLAEVIRRVVLNPEDAVHDQRAARGLPDHAVAVDAVTPVAELLLMNAARAQHVAEIRRRLADGQTIICDRYADATLAYQGAGRGLDITAVRMVINLATGGLVPDLTILLDLDPRHGLRRKPHTQRNRLDDETLAFHEQVRAAYQDLAATEPQRWLTIDASQAPEDIAEMIASQIAQTT